MTTPNPRRPIPYSPEATRADNRYRYDPTRNRWRDTKSGRFVSFAAVESDLEKLARRAADDITAISRALIERTASLAEWQSIMSATLRTAHAAAAASARGGLRQMTPSDWEFTSRRLQTEFSYLQRFALQISDGTQPMTGQLVARARLYAAAAHTTFEAVRHRHETTNRRATFARRVLRPGENCRGCIAESRRGWLPVHQIAPIGSQECRANCRCTILYRTDEEMAEAENQHPHDLHSKSPQVQV